MSGTPVDNPRHDNRTEATILRQSIDGDSAHLLLHIPDDLVYFRGHFSDHPIVPGVVQIKWAVELAARLPLTALPQENFSAITRLKFMRLITPGKQITLQLTVSSASQSLSFRFYDDRGGYSAGQLSFQ